MQLAGTGRAFLAFGRQRRLATRAELQVLRRFARRHITLLDTPLKHLLPALRLQIDLQGKAPDGQSTLALDQLQGANTGMVGNLHRHIGLQGPLGPLGRGRIPGQQTTIRQHQK